MKRIRCQTCGTPLIISEDQKTAYCPGCQKNVSLDQLESRNNAPQGAYVQFLMKDGIVLDSTEKKTRKKKEEDRLSSLSIGFENTSERFASINLSSSKTKPHPVLRRSDRTQMIEPEPVIAEEPRHGMMQESETDSLQIGPAVEISVQPTIPAVWTELEEKTESFTKMDLDITEILLFASDAFAGMKEAERALTVPVWRKYLQAWCKNSQQSFKDKLKQIRSSQERRKKKMIKRLDELNKDLNDQRLAHALDEEAYRRKLDEANSIRESSKRWSILALSLLSVSLVLFLLGFILESMLEGFYFYSMLLKACGIAGMGACLGIVLTELSRKIAAERDLGNLAVGREESDSEQKSIMVLSQAETDILRAEIRKSGRIMDACRTLLSAKNKSLENAMLDGALELSGVQAANSSDPLIRALRIISEKEENSDPEGQLGTLSVFAFNDEEE